MMRVIKFYDEEYKCDRYVHEMSVVYDLRSFISFLCGEHQQVFLKEIHKILAVKTIMIETDTGLMESLNLLKEFESNILQYPDTDEKFTVSFDYLWKIGREI